MPYVVVKSGELKGNCISLKKRETVFGRLESSDIYLPDTNISRQHAKCVLLEDNLTALVDLGSSNGTFVNGLPISRIFLMDGDEIKMGESILAFFEGEPEDASVETAPQSLKITDETPLTAHPLIKTEILTPADEKARLDSLKESYLHLHTLNKLISNLTTASNTSEVFQKVGRAVLLSCGVDRIAFFTFDAHRNRFNLHSTYIAPSLDTGDFVEKFPIHQQVLESIKEERIPYLFTEPRENEEAISPASARPTIMGVPILRENKLLGLIYIDSPRSHQPVDKSAPDFVSPIAAHLGLIAQHLEDYGQLKRKSLALERVINKDLVIVCRNPKMLSIMDTLNRVAETNSTVLICGESGTGKELVARAIHSYSRRRTGPMVCINCASLPETLIESELFGYERGAFTGAISRKPGRFELADGGTVFLDEIGDISLSAQAKILRVLQEGELERVGGTRTIHIDVRVIAATNKNLQAAIEKGEFREDLYYRLKVVEIELPPLRQRTEDIPILAEYFLRTLRKETSSQAVRFSPEAMQILMDYHWQGNVRELRNVVERALVFARGSEILPKHLPAEFARKGKGKRRQRAEVPITLSDLERKHIVKTLEYAGGNKLRAAELLGISRSTLYEKLKQYRIRM